MIQANISLVVLDIVQSILYYAYYICTCLKNVLCIFLCCVSECTVVFIYVLRCFVSALYIIDTILLLITFSVSVWYSLYIYMSLVSWPGGCPASESGGSLILSRGGWAVGPTPVLRPPDTCVHSTLHTAYTYTLYTQHYTNYTVKAML